MKVKVTTQHLTRMMIGSSNVYQLSLSQINLSLFLLLSKPQPNLNTMVGFDNKMTLHHPTPLHRNSMSAISQLLLTQFCWNCKGRFLWTFRTDSNCQGDICRCNICPRDICPYQEYLSCYWPDFDETLQVGSWEHLEQIPTVTCPGNVKARSM